MTSNLGVLKGSLQNSHGCIVSSGAVPLGGDPVPALSPSRSYRSSRAALLIISARMSSMTLGGVLSKGIGMDAPCRAAPTVVVDEPAVDVIPVAPRAPLRPCDPVLSLGA